jgi:hypothetical protein
VVDLAKQLTEAREARAEMYRQAVASAADHGPLCRYAAAEVVGAIAGVLRDDDGADAARYEAIRHCYAVAVDAAGLGQVERSATVADYLAEELARWESGQRRLAMPVVQSVPDGLRYAAELVRAAHEVDDYRLAELMRGAGIRLRALHDAASQLLAEAVVTREENRQLREAGEDLDGALALAIAHHGPECRCCDHQALARWRES